MWRCLKVASCAVVLTVCACAAEDEKPGRGGAADTGDLRSGGLVVDPAAVDFGLLGSDEERLESLVLRNLGSEAVPVAGLVVEGDPGFEVQPSVVDLILGAGEELTFAVTFRPQVEGQALARVLPVTVPAELAGEGAELVGEGSVPNLDLTPEDADFGVVALNCVEEQVLTFTNVGSEGLEVETIRLEGGQFALAADIPVPFTLAPGEARALKVSLEADRLGPVSGTLAVQSNDPRGEQRAFLSGEVAYGEFVDRHVVGPAEVDLLFALDLSCSMDARYADFGLQVSALTDRLTAIGWDWQVGVVTRDIACVDIGLFDAGSPNLEATLQRIVETPLGIFDKVQSETLLRLSALTLQNTVDGVCNDGFLRPGAPVHVVVVSDEPEQSGDPEGYLAQMQGLVGGDRLVVSGALNLSGCYSFPPYGYREAVASTGGLSWDLCPPDWAENLLDLADVMGVGSSVVPLSQAPIAGTLQVTVDGAPSTDWTLLEDPPALSFDPKPPEGVLIEARYQADAPCGD